MACPTCGPSALCQCLMENPDGARVAGAGSMSAPFVVDQAALVVGKRGTIAAAQSGIGGKTTTYTITPGPMMDATNERPMVVLPVGTPGTTTEQVQFGSRDGQPNSTMIAGTIQAIFAVGSHPFVSLLFDPPLPSVPRAVLIGPHVNAGVGGFSSAASRRVYLQTLTTTRIEFFIAVPITGATATFSFLVVL